MMQIIAKAKRKGQLAARMDCVEISGTYYFTWLSMPLVTTKKNNLPREEEEHKNVSLGRMLSSWICRFLGTATHGVVGISRNAPESQAHATTIEQLWLDIRILEPNVTAELAPYDRTAWEVCAVLKHIFEHGPDPVCKSRKTSSIDEVVLNVLPQEPPHNSSLVYRWSSLPLTVVHDVSKNWTEVLRDQLVNVWNKIWAANDFNTVDYQARHYRMLLEKINSVRICVDGETFRTRELALELERGRAEMRRIERR
jgi:hypothetical protein